MKNAGNIKGAFNSRSKKVRFQILLAGADRSTLEQVEAHLPDIFEIIIWELTVLGMPRQSVKHDVVVLVGWAALSYLKKVKLLSGSQTPIIGYELKADADERVLARAGGVISLVGHSPEETELIKAIENVLSWVSNQGAEKEQNADFKKELLAALGYLFKEQPSFGIQDLSQRMKLSHSTLYRKVREVYNLSPNRLIAAYRSQQAAVMLIESKFNITEIAYTCGFSSSTYLARTFKQFYGMTPGEFRKNKSIPARFVRIIE
jgi:AraC-like DNA-binding protein